MTAIYTWDVFSTVDGYGSYGPEGDWGGYWSKQGPELLKHRAALFDTDQRMVFGATTFRENAQLLTSGTDPNALDEWNRRTMAMPATVISSTLHDTLGWPDATIVSGDAVEIVSRLKAESHVPLRSQASLSLNWALIAAGLVDRIRVPSSRSSPDAPEPARSSAEPATSISTSSSIGHSTATPRNSSTNPRLTDMVRPRGSEDRRSMATTSTNDNNQRENVSGTPPESRESAKGTTSC